MSLLDDIEAEKHEFLLREGNLVKKKPAVSWSDENSWTSQGYLARVLVTRCQCGQKSHTLLGIFHKETTPSGKSREQALDPRNFQVPLGQHYPILLEFVPPVAVCPFCLPSKGFSLS